MSKVEYRSRRENNAKSLKQAVGDGLMIEKETYQMPHEIENAKRQGKYENIRIKGKTAEYKSLPGSSSQTPPNPLTLTATSGSTVDQHHYHSSSIYCDPRRTAFSYNNLSYPSPPSYHSRPSTVSSSVLPWQTQDTGDPQAHAYSISSNPHTHSAQPSHLHPHQHPHPHLHQHPHPHPHVHAHPYPHSDVHHRLQYPISSFQSSTPGYDHSNFYYPPTVPLPLATLYSYSLWVGILYLLLH